MGVVSATMRSFTRAGLNAALNTQQKCTKIERMVNNALTGAYDYLEVTRVESQLLAASMDEKTSAVAWLVSR